MPLPRVAAAGPERATVRDIPGLNRVFSEAFTDRYRRDGLVGVRVPHLNPLVWRYAIEDADGGAMVWRDEAGDLIAFNMVHRSGREGWMGPLAVRPDRQQEGVGKAVVRAGIAWLQAEGVATIGLETMPRTVDNIGFYSRQGFLPGPLTITLTRGLAMGSGTPGPLLSGAGPRADAVVQACRAATEALVPGVDYSRELLLTRELGLGDTSLVERDGEVHGFALWHSASLAAGRAAEELRVLKVVARDVSVFERLLDAMLAAGHGLGLRRLAVRYQARYPEVYRVLVRRGFQVHWTDLRMTLDGYPESATAGGIVFSNWEI